MRQPTRGARRSISAPGVSAGDPHLAVNALGNAVAIWRTDGAVSLVQVAHYSATAGTWSASATLSSLEQPAGLPTVGVDGEGNAFAAWRRLSDGVVQAARYCVQFGVWDPSPDVSAPGRQPETAPVIAVETGGGAVLAWGHWASTGGVVVQAARWTVSTGTWSPSMTLSTSRVDAGAFYPAVAVDGSGNATVGWELLAAGQVATVETARFTATTGTWGASVDLSGPGTRHAVNVQVAMDGSGNAIAIWTRNGILQTARYSWSTATWSAPHESPRQPAIASSIRRSPSPAAATPSPPGNAPSADETPSRRPFTVPVPRPGRALSISIPQRSTPLP